MLDLTRIDLATEEDRAFHIDYWASLFKAATWEEIKMLAEKDAQIADMQDTVSEKDAQIADMQNAASERDARIAALTAELERVKRKEY